MEFVLALLSGLILGCIHAFDADHVIAVTAFASKHPNPRKAISFGIIWGVGHTVTVLTFGLVSLAFKFIITPHIELIAEVGVGMLLVAIGSWVFIGLLRQKGIHIHKHTHDGKEHIHFHSHGASEDHRHTHSMFLVGATHGLAGTAAVMVIIPVTLTQSIDAAALFLVLFGAGTTIAMAVFALCLGMVTTQLRSRNILPVFQGIAGVASICLGLLWIGQRIASL